MAFHRGLVWRFFLSCKIGRTLLRSSGRSFSYLPRTNPFRTRRAEPSDKLLGLFHPKSVCLPLFYNLTNYAYSVSPWTYGVLSFLTTKYSDPGGTALERG